MSIEYEQFTVELSLQHMTMVRISEHLLRKTAPRVVHLLCNGPFYDFRSWWHKRNNELNEEIEFMLCETIETFCIPAKLKKTLSDYMSAMGLRMFRCLRRMQHAMIEAKDVNHTEKLSYFIDKFSWDNFGCVDIKKMIEAYVSNKETIDYATWTQLCGCFSEDNIRRFSTDINWNDTSLTHSDYSAFWYYKIFKLFPQNFNGGCVQIYPPFPPHDLLHRRQRRPLRRHPHRHPQPHPQRIEECFNRRILQTSFEDDNISVFKYFSNQLKDEPYHDAVQNIMYSGRFNQSSHPRSLKHIISEVYVYVLGQIKNLKRNVVWQRDLAHWRMTFFMDWPWVFCVHSWRNVFQAYEQNYQALTEIMLNTFEIITKEREIRSQEMLYIQHCQIFEELWDVWYENSLGGDIGRKAIDIGWLALLLKDINLCKVIFRKNDETRMHFLLEVGAHSPLIMIGTLDHDFWKAFMREVIVNDYERDTFKDMFHHNSMKQHSSDDVEDYEDNSSYDEI